MPILPARPSASHADFSRPGRIATETTDPFTWWRTRPPTAFAPSDLDLLTAALAECRPPSLPRWTEAVAGDPAASIAAAFACFPVGTLPSRWFDVAMTAVLACALVGDRACTAMLVHALGRQGRRSPELSLVLLAGAWRHPRAASGAEGRTTSDGKRS